MDDILQTAVGGPKTPGENEVAYWLRQIDQAGKREESFLKEAREYVKIYEAEKRASNSFNILYSNTETLSPALYNELPRAVVKRRYKDDDLVGREAGRVLERSLEYLIDTPDEKYDPFGSLMESAVLSALVPGRGITRFTYDSELTSDDGAAFKQAAIEEEGAADLSGDEDGEEAEVGEQEALPGVEAQPDQVLYETVCGESVAWDRIRFGFARRWKDVPWVAFEHRMTKVDVAATFGKEWVAKLRFVSEKGEDEEKLDEKRVEVTTVIWEVWHKGPRSIVFVCETYKDGPVKRMKDPLGLSGFYNIPEPLMLFQRVDQLVPVPLYKLYEEQAKELNRITQRINKIVEALKVRGYYDKGIGDLQQLLSQEDNVLLPVESVGAMREGATVENSIWLMPLEKLVQVLQQLYVQRQQIKQVIYEVTGISDILRGSTVASETATAQNLKNQWGTLRLKRMQKRVQRYVRDCLRICAEIVAEHFSPETLAKQTGLKFPTGQEKELAQQQMQQLQGQMQMMQEQSQPAPQMGAPPSPEGATAPDAAQAGPPPQMEMLQQQMQQLQSTVSVPSWDEIMAVLKDELTRNYRIDIETNSTVDPEAVEDKTAVGEMLQALSGLFQQVMPAAQSGVMPLGAVKAMLLAVMRRYSFGPEVEEALKAMPDQMPQSGPDPKQVEKQTQELQKKERELQQEGQSLEQEKAKLKMEADMLKFKQQQAEETLKMKTEAAEARLELKFQKLEMQLEEKAQQAEVMQERKRMMDEQTVMEKLHQGELALSQKDYDRKTQLAERTAAMKGAERGRKEGQSAAVGPLDGVAQAILASLQQMQAPKPPGRKRVRIARNQQGAYEGEVLEE